MVIVLAGPEDITLVRLKEIEVPVYVIIESSLRKTSETDSH